MRTTRLRGVRHLETKRPSIKGREDTAPAFRLGSYASLCMVSAACLYP